MGKQKGKTAKGAKAGNLKVNQDEELAKAPHSFVFHRGQVGKNIVELEKDIRRVMEPYTAKNLKIRKKNVLKDFVSIAGPLNVSHFMVLGKSETSVNLRLVKLPRGPTLTFKVENYVLARDIISSLRKSNMEPKQFQHHPLLVMNNMNVEGMQIKLMATMFQNMFPSINVNKVKLKEIRRCVLLNYNEETKHIDFRHYNIRAVPVGMSRGVKKLVKAKIPNLSKYDDVSEYLLKGDASESEAEIDGPHNEVDLPQDMSSRGNIKATKSAIRLTEIGPRFTLQLLKVEEGVAEGKVLFHEYVEKTAEELQKQSAVREKSKQLKEHRKSKQAENLLRKKTEKEKANKKALAGMKREEPDSDVENPEASEVVDSDDDVAYYKQEVGEEPDTELFPKKQNFRKRKDKGDHAPTLKKSKPSYNQRSPFKTNEAPNKKLNSGKKENHKQLTNSKQGSPSTNKLKQRKTSVTVGNVSRDSNLNKKVKHGVTSKKTSHDKSDKFKNKAFEKKKNRLTDLDKMKRSKIRKQQRMTAKKEGKRRNKPRKI